ncbi:MAG: peptidylprolyl isomerase [Bacteroidales bacterium]|jgi:peptidyl-prolyl cis-trans isomerase SurA|nr:peptidylprolyl isomerase [Bacteroidales bacterium]
MKLKSLLTLLSVLLTSATVAQDPAARVLMTVAGDRVTAGEFLRMYRKSLEPGQEGDIDSYLQLYVNFKLKVADAKSEGIDTTRTFRNELNGYRTQLAQNYLTDPDTREKVLKQTYQRYLTEVNAWHVLISCPEGAEPKDTLAAWQKAAGIRERITGGESFEDVARASSDDPSVKVNGGNLGYFTVFQMITPFEDAAYTLRKGAVSEPVRTPYGYHIIKVTDRRPSRGKILPAHIMKISPPGTGEKEAKAAEDTIRAIYRKLLDGASFSELAGKYSDHRESASRGGKLDWLGTGELITELSEAAFSIRDTGGYSEPVRTPYAWHIIKLLGRKEPGTFEETRSLLESRINQSYLNSLSKKSFIEKLKKEYGFRINQAAYMWFVENTDTIIIQGKGKYNRSLLPPGNIYTFANQRLANSEFASYIERRGSRIVTSDPEYFIKQSIETRLADQIIKYEDSVLEKKYPDFGYLMTEFHDGILLFEISGKKLWNRVQEDSTALMAYYDAHRNEFLTTRAIDAKIYTLRSKKGDRKLGRTYRKYSRLPECDSMMLNKFNRNGDTLLVIREGRFEQGQDEQIDAMEWSPGLKSVQVSSYHSLVNIIKVYEPEPRPFSEVQGEMMTAYQEYLEKEWIKQLKEKYTVKIDDLVLEEIKKQIKND